MEVVPQITLKMLKISFFQDFDLMCYHVDKIKIPSLFFGEMGLLFRAE